MSSIIPHEVINAFVVWTVPGKDKSSFAAELCLELDNI